MKLRECFIYTLIQINPKKQNYWITFQFLDPSYCPAPCCTLATETLEHLLLQCPAYASVRTGLLHKLAAIKNPAVSEIIKSSLNRAAPTYRMQFLLDASVLAETRVLVKNYGETILYEAEYNKLDHILGM